MAEDFEDRLRQSLQARAQDVAPDPAMYREVQRRVRRGRLLRWSFAGAGAIAMVAVAALVVPSVLDRRIEFEPAPVVTQPPSEEHSYAHSAPLPEAGGMVFTDGQAVYAMALDGESADGLYRANFDLDCPSDERCVPITDVAVRPGSTMLSLGALVRTAEGCGAVQWVTRVPDNGGWLGTETPVEAGACATSMAFSPDGGHAGWVVADQTGGWSLQTVDWLDDGPGYADAVLGLPFDGARNVVIEEWVWSEESADAATGYLVLTVENTDGLRSTYRQPIERQGDGALALSLEPEVFGVPDGFEVAAFADSAAGDGRTNYTLEVRRGDNQWRIVQSDFFTGRGADDVSQLDLPPGRIRDAGTLWMAALGDTAIYGDGNGEAHVATWPSDGPPESHGLGPTITHADLLASGPESGPGATRASTHVEVYFALDDGRCQSEVDVFREVQTPAVASGALTELLAGPSDGERADGLTSPFGPETAGALNDVTIEKGIATVDLAHLGEWLEGDNCTVDLIASALERTLLQFPTVEAYQVVFDGDRQAFLDWTASATEPGATDTVLGPPHETSVTAEAIRAAAAARDYDALAELIDRDQFSCSFSDQNEDCIALWREQEEEGLNPLGVLAGLFRSEPAKVEGARIWTWPSDHVEDPEYLGPRTGVDEDGVWRYYQQGGD